MKNNLTTKEYVAIGWTHAFCCSLLDDGEDPRKIEVPEMIEKAEKQLPGRNKDYDMCSDELDSELLKNMKFINLRED